MTEALVAVQARIGEIQSRFAPPAPARTPGSGSDFAAALAAARGDALGAGAVQRYSALTDVSGLSALSGLSGLSGGASLPGLGALGGLGGLAGLADAGGPFARRGTAAAGGMEQAVVAAAQQYLGVPYRWGGTDPATGLDCSGFVQRVFRDVGVELPRVSRDQARAGRPVASIEDARPGDLIAFGSPVDHIGIYVGGGEMLVAPRTGDVVKRQEVYRTPTAIRRVLPEAAGPGGVTFSPAAAGPVRAATRASGGEEFAERFAAAEVANGLPGGLLRAVAAVESGFDPSAVSPAGARGLMQIMPATARALGVDPLDPDQAIDGAARLLAGQLQRFGSLDLALAAYNAGGPAVARHGGIPPYPETQAYVAKVRAQLTGAAA